MSVYRRMSAKIRERKRAREGAGVSGGGPSPVVEEDTEYMTPIFDKDDELNIVSSI